jgi:hypothetical protein
MTPRDQISEKKFISGKVRLHRQCGQAISPSDAISIEDFPSFQNRQRQRQVFIVFTPV